MKTRRLLLLCLALVALFVSESATAQLRSSYFMEGSYFRTELNPALTPTRGYLALPGMSGVGLNIQSNFFSVDKLYREFNGEYISIFDNRVSGAEAFTHLNDINKLNVNANVNILGIGFHSRRTFWSFGFNTRVQGSAILERELFEGLKGGNRSLDGSSLDVSGFGELYLGSSFPLHKNVTMGFRLKALFGFANINGSLTEATRGNLKGDFIFSGMPIERDHAEFFNTDKVFEWSSDHILGAPTNFGLALDLGLEVRLLNDHLKISAAVADVGYIKWHMKQMMKVGVDAQFDVDNSNLGKIYEFGTPEFELDSNHILVDDKAHDFRMLNYSVNVGLEYNFLRNHFAIGLLSHNVFNNNKIRYHELTASLNIRPTNWITLTASHTFMDGNMPGVFGAAVNIHPRVLNIFVGADFVDYKRVMMDSGAQIFTRPVSRSVYAGVGFNFARPREVRLAEKEAKLERKLERKNNRAQKKL